MLAAQAALTAANNRRAIADANLLAYRKQTDILMQQGKRRPWPLIEYGKLMSEGNLAVSQQRDAEATVQQLQLEFKKELDSLRTP